MTLKRAIKKALKQLSLICAGAWLLGGGGGEYSDEWEY